MKHLFSALISLAVAFAAAAAESSAASPLPIEEVLDARSVAAYSPPAFSSDNRLIAYVVTDPARNRTPIDRDELIRTGIAWYGVGSDIWVTDLESGTHRNITSNTGHNWAPAWSPDGRMVAFLADRSRGSQPGPARLWLWDRATGRLRQAGSADVREGFAGIEWTGDSRSILVSLFPADLGRDGFAAAMKGSKPPASSPSTPAGVTAQVFEFDPSVAGAVPMTDQVNLDIFRRDLGLIDVKTGRLRTLTTGQRIAAADLSADGKKLAYAVLIRAEKPGAGQYLYEIVSHDLATDEKRVVASDVPLGLIAGSFSWSPDAELIAYRTGGPTAKDQVYVVDDDGGKPRLIATNDATDSLISRIQVAPPVWDASSRNVYFLRDDTLLRAAIDGTEAVTVAKFEGIDPEIIGLRQHQLLTPAADTAALITLNRATKRSGFAKVDLKTGVITQVTDEHKRYGGYGTEPTISPDGTKVAFVAEDALHPPDIYVMSAADLRARKATEVAPAFTGRALGRAEVVEWRTLDGDVQHGALVYPASYEAGKKYPLIVKVYGGSAISNDLNRFGYASSAIENLQIYATRGYALLLADSKVNLGTPMVDLMKSVMPGINKVIDMGVADPDRIGVTGHSYGGYSTIALIAQSPRFKAAVMRAGFGNLVGGYGQLADDGTNYGLAWAEGGQGRMGGHPWEFRERYLENSPFFYLNRVETPLLIIHGTEDDAVPSYLADEIFTALRRLGKTVTYARYEGEDHWEGSWSYPNQLDALRRSIAWFDKHLK